MNLINRLIIERRSQLFLLFLLTFVFTLLNINKFFFWDNITEISVPANFYFENNFKHTFFIDKLAGGHPTLVPIYIALLWKIFGKSLMVSHLGLFPFVFGVIYQIYRYINKSNTDVWTLWLIFSFSVLDPTLISQLSLVTFDIPHIFFFLWCINNLLEKRKIPLTIAFTLLCMTSLRGTLSAVGVVIFSLLNNIIEKEKISLKNLWPFFPGFVAFIIFLFFFLSHKQLTFKDFILNQVDRSADLLTTVERILKAIGIFIWRLVDYGRLVIILLFGFLFFYIFKMRSFYDTFIKKTFLITLSQFLVFFPVTVFFARFICHRYLLPIIIPITICTGYWILKYSRFPRIVFTITLAVLISGYFWIYPKNIPQGWDSTPAHWSYYPVRKNMLRYMDSNHIQVTETGSFFPNLASFKLIDLSKDIRSFKEADLLKDDYILYSNVFNVPDDKADELFLGNNWIPEKTIERKRVSMILFKHINNNTKINLFKN